MRNRIGMTVLSILLCLVLSPVLMIALCLPQALGLFPVVLLALLGYVGPVSAVGCCAAMAGAAWMLFGGIGALSMAVYLLPILIISAYYVDRRQSFWPSAAGTAITLFASLSAVAALLSAAAGTDVVSAFSELTRQSFIAANPVSDSVLMMLAQTGVLELENGIPQISRITGLLTDAARESLVAQMVTVIDVTLRLEMPMQMATGAVAAGVLGQSVLRRGMRRRGMDIPTEPMRKWRIPKGWGRVLGLTLVALYVMMMLMPGAMSSMTYVFSGVLQQVFALQGIAALRYILHKRGAKRIWHGVVFFAGYFLFSSVMDMLGIVDQLMDFSHRREELDGPAQGDAQ